MKKSISLLGALPLLAATACFAVNWPLKHVDTRFPYAPTALYNDNINAILSATIDAGEGRKQVIVVEPVFIHDTPDAAASGNALSSALQTARTKSYRVLVYVDSGTYEVDSTGLTLPANVTLMGAGESSTVIKANAITSEAPSIANLSLQVTNITQTQTSRMHNIAVTGGIIVNGGNITLTDMQVNAPSAAAITINGVSGYTLKNVQATSGATGLAINNTVQGIVEGSTLVAETPIDVTENAAATFANNVYRKGAPRFYGNYKTSLQKCHNNIDADTGLPVPNYASGVSQLCVVPTAGAAQ